MQRTAIRSLRRVSLTAAAAAPLVLPTLSHAKALIAQAPATCSQMASPYDYTAQAASKCFTIQPLISVTPLPGGGSDYSYAATSGQTVSEPVPPTEFDALTATAAQLQEYALPPRPSSLEALAQWTSLMARATYAQPPRFLAAERMQLSVPAPASTQASPAAVDGIFAGYQTQTGSYTSGSVNYTEPSLGAVSCSDPDTRSGRVSGRPPGPLLKTAPTGSLAPTTLTTQLSGRRSRTIKRKSRQRHWARSLQEIRFSPTSTTSMTSRPTAR